MRRLLLLACLTLVAAACSDSGVAPTSPDGIPTTIRASHTGGDPATDDLCGGLSPCDAFDYRPLIPGPADLGVAGFCFLPPAVDNHTSDPACSGDFVPGLDGQLQLAYCQVEYPTVGDVEGGPPDGSRPPTIVPGSCQSSAQWKDFVQEPGAEFYKSQVQFKKNTADDGDIFRLYVVRNGTHFAHRDVIVNSNFTPPADGFVHAIGNGKEPVKLRVTEGSGCAYFDTQGVGTNNAASCLITGGSVVELEGEGGGIQTTFLFPDGNPAFFAEFEQSECLSLGFNVVDDTTEPPTIAGNASVDVPLADCKVTLTSEELESLTVPGRIELTLTDARWLGGVFQDARLNVIQEDEFGQGVLPPVQDQPWFGGATSSFALLNAITGSLNRVAAFLGVKPLIAQGGAGFSFRRLSDFQVALMPVMNFDPSIVPEDPDDCTTPAPHCLNLGTVPAGAPVPVSVTVTAPGNTAPDAAAFPVPDTRLHFFPLDGGTADCPDGSAGTMLDPRGCYPAFSDDYSTVPPSTWDHTVVVTGDDGVGGVDWNLGAGSNPHEIKVLACGVARLGPNEPNPPSEPGADGVWGDLGFCSERSVTATGFDNGPADGFTPYEPVDNDYEVAIYGLPLTFQASTCPIPTVNGTEDPGEWPDECVEKTGFIVNLPGPKPTEPNGWLYTFNDGTDLYAAIKVETNSLIDVFLNFDNDPPLSPADVDPATPGVQYSSTATENDDQLVLRTKGIGAPGEFTDRYQTLSCTQSQGKTLCGADDTTQDGTGAADAVGFAFFEFKHPLCSNPPDSQDFCVASGVGDNLGVYATATGGSGGGKGNFIFPDFRVYQLINID